MISATLEVLMMIQNFNQIELIQILKTRLNIYTAKKESVHLQMKDIIAAMQYISNNKNENKNNNQ